MRLSWQSGAFFIGNAPLENYFPSVKDCHLPAINGCQAARAENLANAGLFA
jgi:hypothetical protein